MIVDFFDVECIFHISLPSWTYRMDAVLATNAVQVKQFLGNTYRC